MKILPNTEMTTWLSGRYDRYVRTRRSRSVDARWHKKVGFEIGREEREHTTHELENHSIARYLAQRRNIEFFEDERRNRNAKTVLSNKLTRIK